MKQKTKNSLIEVNINDLMRHPGQPRKDENEGLEALKKSINANGIANPPIVIHHEELGGKYYIVAGHRRVRALRELGRTSVEVILKDNSIKDIITPLVENAVRVDLHLLEYSKSIYNIYKQTPNIMLKEIAEMLGKDIAFVQRANTIGGLSRRIFNVLMENKELRFTSSPYLLSKIAKLAAVDCDSEDELGEKKAYLLVKDFIAKEKKDGYKSSIYLEMADKTLNIVTDLINSNKKSVVAETVLDEDSQDTEEDIFEKMLSGEISTEQQEEDFESKEVSDTKENIDEFNSRDFEINESNKVVGDGFRFKHNKEFTILELSINTNKLSQASAENCGFYLKKIIAEIS